MLSFDVAIYVEADNGYMYRLMNDKNTGRYIWNQVPKSKNYEDKMQSIKENGEWEDFKARWEKIIIALFKKCIRTAGKRESARRATRVNTQPQIN